MWGSSPDNIWAVASGASYKDCLWHYDGKKRIKSSQLLSSAVYTLFGFNADDIWAGDGYSTIWKYNGNKWYKFTELSLSGYDNVIISSIYGKNPHYIYAVGFAQ
jgi:hypothetical protein